MATPLAARSHLGVRFALLVGALFGVAVLVLLLVHETQRRSLADLLRSETHERSEMTTGVVELTAQALRDFTYDYALWDDMVKFVETADRRWAAINIDASFDNFKLAAVWVLRPDGSLVYATAGEDPKLPKPPLPLGEAALRRVIAAGKQASFFVSGGDGVREICVAPVQPSEDLPRATPPRGWLIAARQWDEAQLKQLGEILQGEVVLAPATSLPPRPPPNQISFQHSLPGVDGVAVANLICTLSAPELEIVSQAQRLQLAVLIGTFALTGLVAGIFIFRWIVRPLDVLGSSLQWREPDALAPLLDRPDEIGRVAQAVQNSFEQHAALEQMIEQRTRLGRELHDGVIQTVYAAGMSLAGARSTLRRDPAAAERILDDTRAELNSTIQSLRNFIHGLEPEPLQQRTLREAVQSIVNLMQGVRRVDSTLLIDDTLVTVLSGQQRLHLLQITREAVSNSVRHGQANHLRLRLEREGAGVILEIADDGVGIDAGATPDGGRGLVNLTARARELGGELEVTSPAGGGVCLRVVIPVRDATTDA